jgi:glucose-1-phosphate adenylyltransferase
MRAIGIILAGGNSSRMGDLSAKRATAAMPMAGCYRAIDFSLSNMSNSHIQKVAVYTQYNSRSLNEHLNSSKWWDFGRKQGGLYIFTPTITATNSYWYKGTADALYQNIGFLKDAHEPYVVIASGDGVYKMDYNKVLEDHIAKNADITIVTKEIRADEDDISRFGVVKVGDNGRVLDFEEKPLVAETSTASIGVYVVRRRQLIELLETCAAEGRMHLEGQKNYARSKFKEIYGLFDTDMCFYFVIKGKAYYILPRDSVEGGSDDDLKKYMEKKCGKRFVHYDTNNG